MHAGLLSPACSLNQTRRTLGIPNDSISPESALGGRTFLRGRPQSAASFCGTRWAGPRRATARAWCRCHEWSRRRSRVVDHGPTGGLIDIDALYFVHMHLHGMLLDEAVGIDPATVRDRDLGHPTDEPGAKRQEQPYEQARGGQDPTRSQVKGLRSSLQAQPSPSESSCGSSLLSALAAAARWMGVICEETSPLQVRAAPGASANSL
jgi:hypothetical protein